MDRWRAIGSLALIGAVAAIAIPGEAVLAQKMIRGQWGWVVARHDTTPSYTPTMTDRGNSAGGVNTVTRTSAGSYVVHMPGLAASGFELGTANATAMGNSNRACIVGEWDSGGTEETVYVRCYALNGTAADSNFSVNYLQASGVSGRIAYAWAEDPTFPGQYTPNTSYNVDSQGGLVSVNHYATGYYRVKMPHLAAKAGNVQITDNYSPGTCRFSSWTQSSSDEQFVVVCRALGGAAANRQFTITYVDGMGLKGPGYKHQAYAYANQPTVASYHPSPNYRYSTSGQTPTIQRLGTGKYSVAFPGQPPGGGAQVTTNDAGSARCIISSIRTSSSPAEVGIACYGGNGSALDTKFTVAWER